MNMFFATLEKEQILGNTASQNKYRENIICSAQDT